MSAQNKYTPTYAFSMPTGYLKNNFNSSELTELSADYSKNPQHSRPVQVQIEMRPMDQQYAKFHAKNS